MSTTKQENGGYAFPRLARDAWDDFCGMTLRDYFAAKAMQALLADYMKASTKTPHEIVKTSAEACYVVADAMLAARSAK